MKKIYLVDTHVFLWLSYDDGHLLRQEEIKVLNEAGKEGNLFVPAISLWEIAMLARKERIDLTMPTLQWIQETLQKTHIQIIPLSPEIAVESQQLPGNFHFDPADQLIVATARVMNAILITHDGKIIQYGEEKYVQVF